MIIVLDRKPPLNWSVTYANTRPARHEDPLAELLDIVLREDLDRQTPLHAVPTVGAAAGGVSAAPCITACRPPFPPPNVVHSNFVISLQRQNWWFHVIMSFLTILFQLESPLLPGAPMILTFPIALCVANRLQW